MIILLFLVSFFIIRRLIIKYYEKHWKDNLTAGVYFETDFINEGESGYICEELVNDKLLPLSAVNVKFELDKEIDYEERRNIIVSDKQYRSDLMTLGSHKKLLRRFKVNYTKRGVYTIDGLSMNTIDPVSENLYVEKFPSRSTIYVYPAYSKHRELLKPFSRMMGEALKNRFIYEDPFEFKGIRNYTTSDPMKKINWSATAKTGDLMVNSYYDTTSRHVTVFLDITTTNVWKKYDQMEEAIRITRNLMEELVRNRIPVQIVTNARDCFEGNNIAMESGAGANTVIANLRNLTVIDLDKDTEPMMNYFKDKESEPDELPVLISTDNAEGLVHAFEKYLGNNNGEWIMPVMSSKERCINSRKIQMTYVEVSRI